jgi:hypothetical protein
VWVKCLVDVGASSAGSDDVPKEFAVDQSAAVA